MTTFNKRILSPPPTWNCLHCSHNGNRPGMILSFSPALSQWAGYFSSSAAELILALSRGLLSTKQGTQNPSAGDVQASSLPLWLAPPYVISSLLDGQGDGLAVSRPTGHLHKGRRPALSCPTLRSVSSTCSVLVSHRETRRMTENFEGLR